LELAYNCSQHSTEHPDRSSFESARCNSQAALLGTQPARSSSQATAPAAEDSAPASKQHAQGLYLYNTTYRTRQRFRPRQDVGNRVIKYVCGVTADDFSHIGHARVYVSIDVLYRLLDAHTNWIWSLREIKTAKHACGQLMSYSPGWVPSTQQSIRATRQQREAVTIADGNCVI
jgi:hypothetical protein